MRKKVNHTFLGGRRSFYYRDIFSGLGSEKMGPALLCSDESGDDSKELEQTLTHYFHLLLRYGLRKHTNPLVVERLVKKVIEDQIHLGGIYPSRSLQRILCKDLQLRIYYHQQSTIFNKGYLKIPINSLPIHWLKGLYERKPKNPT